MEWFIAFLAGLIVGCCVGAVLMGILVATREEAQRYR